MAHCVNPESPTYMQHPTHPQMCCTHPLMYPKHTFSMKYESSPKEHLKEILWNPLVRCLFTSQCFLAYFFHDGGGSSSIWITAFTPSFLVPTPFFYLVKSKHIFMFVLRGNMLSLICVVA